MCDRLCELASVDMMCRRRKLGIRKEEEGVVALVEDGGLLRKGDEGVRG